MNTAACKKVHTIVAPKDEVVDGLQPEQSQEVPRQTRHPSHVQVPRANARLQH